MRLPITDRSVDRCQDRMLEDEFPYLYYCGIRVRDTGINVLGSST